MKESKPLVGSSANRINGSVRISLAKASRLFSPPLIPLVVLGIPMTVSSHFFKLSFRKQEKSLFFEIFDRKKIN